MEKQKQHRPRENRTSCVNMKIALQQQMGLVSSPSPSHWEELVKKSKKKKKYPQWTESLRMQAVRSNHKVCHLIARRKNASFFGPFLLLLLHLPVFRYRSHLWGCAYRHSCSVMLIPCFYLVSLCLLLFVCLLSLYACDAGFFLSVSLSMSWTWIFP